MATTCLEITCCIKTKLLRTIAVWYLNKNDMSQVEEQKIRDFRKDYCIRNIAVRDGCSVYLLQHKVPDPEKQ